MGIDTTDKTDTTNTPQEGSSMSDSRDEAIEAGARPIPAIPFNQMTVDGKLVHAITTNSYGITKLRKYSDSLADTIGEVRKEYMEWEERLKGMRIELTPGEEQPSAMLERLAKHDEFLEFLREASHAATIAGEERGNRITELAVRTTALEGLEELHRDIDGIVERALEGCDLNDWDSFCTLQQEARDNADGLDGLRKGLVEVKATHEEGCKLIADKPGWEDLDERIETRTADFVTDDYLGDWMADNGYIHESNFGDAFADHVSSSGILEEVQSGLDIESIASEVQDNLDMCDLASEVQSNLDMYSFAQELEDYLSLDDMVAGVMASEGCRVLKENPGFADELCDMVLASAEGALNTRIHDALKDAVLEGLSRVTSIPAFQEATNLHLRMDELAKSVESVKAMVKDLEHF